MLTGAFLFSSKTEVIPIATTKITNIYEYGISADNKISTTKKVVMYVYSSKDEYEKVKKEYDPQVGIDGIISDATFNDDEQSVSVVANMTLEEITSELSFAGVPTGFEDLVVYHEGRGDTCDLS